MVGDGRKRYEWSTEEFRAAMEILPDVLDSRVRQIKRVQNG